MAVLIFASSGYDPVLTEKEISPAELLAWHGLSYDTIGFRDYIALKLASAQSKGWTVVSSTLDSLSLTKIVTEVGNVSIVKTRQYFVR